MKSTGKEVPLLEPVPLSRLMAYYLMEKRKTAGLFLFSMLFFYFVCLLYQLENITKLLYAFFLWAFLGLCAGISGFIKYAKRYRAVYTAFINRESLRELLPEPTGITERQYRQITDMLLDEIRQLKSQAYLKDTDMTDYYTMWAHQIKIPIAAMKLLLQSGQATQPGHQDGGTGSDSGRLLDEELFRIEQYVEMVLYYQRLDSITSDFLFKKYDLRDIVNQAVKKHAMFFINSRLSFYMEEFSCSVVTDEKWLQFVIEQLLSNALKYTRRGGISIRLEETDETALLIIEDTGIGIRPEDLPRIFERGYTGYNGRLDKKSTGIGLYMCKKVLEKLSHTIKVTSEVGKGTQVAIGFILTKL